MEHNLPGDGSSVWIPIGRRPEIGDFLQVVHAFEMRKHFASMSKEIREYIVDVSVTVENVGDDNVQIGGKAFFNAKPTETGKSLLLQKC